MAWVRGGLWGPLGDFEALLERWPRPQVPEGAVWAPACGVAETDESYVVRVELPGVQKEDVHVHLDGGLLTVSGVRRELVAEPGSTLHRQEIATGRFARRFALPSDSDGEAIDAVWEDAGLTVTVPRSRVLSPAGRVVPVR